MLASKIHVASKAGLKTLRFKVMQVQNTRLLPWPLDFGTESQTKLVRSTCMHP